MTKTLKQIQKENRKFILEAIHGCSYDEALKIEGQEIKLLTLSRVLLALKDNKIGFYDDSLGYIVSAKFSVDHGCYEDEVEYICDWDLSKETLEEQTEETQRKINELFTN